MSWTPYAELDQVLAEITSTAREALREAFVGAYVEGSFALGAGDLASDVDFLVVVDGELDEPALTVLRALHADLPQRPGFWCRHVEGSFPLAADLLDPTAVGREWWFVDHGSADLIRDPHGNDAVHRWVLREHGIVLAGPPPAGLVAPVTADDLRTLMREQLPTLRAANDAWLDYDIAWCQRSLVTDFCRHLFTLTEGTVTSKSGALAWAAGALDPRWRPLLAQVAADRAGWDPDERPRPGSVQAAWDFTDYALGWAAEH